MEGYNAYDRAFQGCLCVVLKIVENAKGIESSWEKQVKTNG